MIWIMGLISLGVTLILLRPLGVRTLGAHDDGKSHNGGHNEGHSESKGYSEGTHLDSEIAEYKTRLDDLERDISRGLIEEEDASLARAEISRKLLRIKRQSQEGELKPASQTGIAQNGKFIHLGTFVAIAMLPIFAWGLYQAIGNPDYADQPLKARINAKTAGAQQVENGLPPSEEQVEKLIAQLEARLAENPQEKEGWALLARTYEAMGRLEQSERAWKSLLEVEPNNQDGLWFAGVAAARAGRGDEARLYWLSLQSQYNQGTQDYDLIEQALNSLK